MPDKNQKKGCGKECTRCWRNKLKHANKLKKKCFPKMFEDNSSNKEEETSKEYNSNIEEFIDKYLVLNYTKDRFNEYNGDGKRYNELLIDDTTSAYNEWLLKEKKIKKKIKDDKFREFLDKLDYNISYETAISNPNITDRYWPDFYVTAGFYMFECSY